jgi:LPPG:FO 2-phospho-L-lactate transferase
MITILAGGTGSVKLVRGIYKECKDITVVTNVADNFWFHGLYVCPDIDTIIYGLCDRLDKKKGWGLEGDTFNFLKHLKEIDEESWFGIGDKDLTTHIIRTKMLKEGKKLSEITDFFVNKYNLPVRIIPASDDHYETHIITKDYKEMHLQEFWIKYKGSVPILDVIHKNIERAQTTESIKKILENSKLIVFAPGNPITSIGSIIKIKSFDKIIRALKKKVVIISPFVSNKAISGPSEIYMKAKNIEPTTNGLVNFYSEFTNDMVFSKKDRKEIKEKIEKKYPDINFHFTDILMNTPVREEKFAKYIISKFHSH